MGKKKVIDLETMELPLRKSSSKQKKRKKSKKKVKTVVTEVTTQQAALPPAELTNLIDEIASTVEEKETNQPTVAAVAALSLVKLKTRWDRFIDQRKRNELK